MIPKKLSIREEEKEKLVGTSEKANDDMEKGKQQEGKPLKRGAITRSVSLLSNSWLRTEGKKEVHEKEKEKTEEKLEKEKSQKTSLPSRPKQ